MNPGDRQAGSRLLEQAVACEFRVLRSEVTSGPDGGEFAMRIELQFCFDPEEDFPGDDSPAIGFLFALALLSFEDARPRGFSEREYREGEEFSLGAFLEGLCHTIGGARRRRRVVSVRLA